ncbi:MAG: chromosomal replication initiator protein [Acidimicrobiaceae bacterium]|nr:chromosomal replication initiator protein [Acidimicrobiaceae bacterium]MDQ1443728.1 chromosomal replication initiator protein [Acidimicrobiaceae bacterium]
MDQLVDDRSSGEAKPLVTNAERLWILCSQAVRAQVSEATWRAWFEGVHPLRADDAVLVLGVPSSLAKERIEARYLALIRDLLTDETGRDLDVQIEVVAGSAPESDEVGGLLSRPGWEEHNAAGRAPGAGGNGASGQHVPPPPPGREDTPLNPRYTFEAFVIGASNRFAHAAALSVAETPAKSYNPLFVHGEAGLGKTHLLHAIGNYVKENFPARHVRYVSTETFMNEFVDAIRTNTTTAFKRRYRECDVLLIDDIQFMENKEGLQEEFFHTFNSLYGAQKQIVITSDRPPKSIATLEDRLRSRFLSGLITDVQPPELETRLAILRKKAEGERAQVPDEVLEFIATHVKDNIRELEGAFIRVSAFASLNREPLTRELAEKVLSDIIADGQPRQITPKVILDATADMFGFPVDELIGTSRRRPLVTARQVGMYVFRELTDFSYPAIAREFGGRDHTTVIHAVDKVSALMKERRQIYDQVTELIHRIKSGG